jgi:putative endonuclease
METIGYIYILTNQNNTVLYTGVASDLVKRVQEHKEHRYGGFTKKYDVTRLVYYETFSSIERAIEREKQIKSGSRQKKNNLINSINPEWKDLCFDISGFEK